tara:strand:+ start:258 stop:1457 length:1200 start_codon:yes stop_codon:yes gene_type:complete
MAFNFMSFLGGAAEQLTEVIETREQERLYDARLDRATERELSTFEKKQKMQAERETLRAEEDAKKKAEEAANFLNSLGYTDAQSTSILSGGFDSVTYHSNLGIKARESGVDVQTLIGETAKALNEPSDSLNTESKSSVLTNELVESLPVLSPDLEAISSLYDDDKKTFDSIQKAYSHAEQQAYNETDPTKQAEYRAQADHYKKLIDKELEDNAARDNKDDKKFDTAITTFYNGALSRAANTLELESTMEGGVFQLVKGSKSERNITRLMAAREMYDYNQIFNEDGTPSGKVKSLNLKNRLEKETKQAMGRISSYALQEIDALSDPKTPKDENGIPKTRIVNTMANPVPEADLQKVADKYNYGDIIFVQNADGTTSVRVFTDVYLHDNHNRYVNVGNING